MRTVIGRHNYCHKIYVCRDAEFVSSYDGRENLGAFICHSPIPVDINGKQKSAAYLVAGYFNVDISNTHKFA